MRPGAPWATSPNGKCWLIRVFLQDCWPWHPNGSLGDAIFSSSLLCTFHSKALSITVKKCNHSHPHRPSEMTCHETMISGKVGTLFPHSPILSQMRSVSTSLCRVRFGQSMRPACVFLLMSLVLWCSSYFFQQILIQSLLCTGNYWKNSNEQGRQSLCSREITF